MRLLLLPAILMIVVCLLIDLYIYKVLKQRFTHYRWPAIAQVVTASLLNIAIIVIISLRRNSGGDDLLLVVMWGLVGYLSIYLAKAIFVVFDLIASLPRLWHKPRWKWLSRSAATLAIVLLAVTAWGCFHGRFMLKVNPVDITIPNLPESFDGYRIAQISDFHVGTYGSDTTFVAKVVEQINSLGVDAVMFTGDIVNRHATELAPFVRTFSHLKAPDGVFAILGNHDYGDYRAWPSPEAKQADRQQLLGYFSQMGWRLLLNQTDKIGRGNDSIAVIGVENIGDPPFKVYGSLHEAYPNLADSTVKILLSHNPAHWVDSISGNPGANVALTLSGHTHAMQITLGGWSPAKYRYPTWGGLYTDSLGHQMYVNIGVGTVGMPMRIGAVPEITLFTLRRP